ncbi:hypothetical protein [Desnuesiella massiliensis]|uniref:hypothetical protein n=1 Tax=Desnuesiella massiliensis TaxID=1650662 RepID=UPI0006E1B7CA|nr:hypothetical protein [Desnuesiella massiliensis]
MNYGIYFSTGLIASIDYWRPLITEYIGEADGIRIDCWNGEEQIISTLKKLCYDLDLESNCDMHIFKFNITEEVINDGTMVEMIFNEQGDFLKFGDDVSEKDAEKAKKEINFYMKNNYENSRNQK